MMKLFSLRILVLICIVLVGIGWFFLRRPSSSAPVLPLQEEVVLTPEERQNLEATVAERVAFIENGCVGEENCYSANLDLGIKYESLGQPRDALHAYEEASRIRPVSYIPYSNIGSLYRRHGFFAEAEASFRTALERQPDSTTVYEKLYELLFFDLRNPPHIMAQFFDDAVAHTPNDLAMSRLYASYLDRIKDYPAALAVYESLLQADPENTNLQNKIEQIRRLMVERGEVPLSTSPQVDVGAE